MKTRNISKRLLPASSATTANARRSALTRLQPTRPQPGKKPPGRKPERSVTNGTD